MALATWVARFVVDNGRVTEEGNRLRSFERRRLDEPDVDLHLLHEPRGAKAEDLGAQALDAIGRHFLNDRLSLTGGLSRALRETHQTLLDWNRRSLPRDHVGVGITAALVGGNTVYLAQAGPGLAFLRRGSNLIRLEPAEDSSPALGEANMEPSLRRLDLQAGDLLLAASVVLLEAVPEDQLAELMARSTDDLLPEIYLRTRDLPAFALFAITCIEEDAEAADAGEDDAVATAPGVPASGGTTTQTMPFDVASLRERRVRSGDGPTLVYPETRAPVDISRPVVNLRSDRSTGRNDYARTTGTDRRFNFKLTDTRVLQIAAVIVVAAVLIMFVPSLVRESRSERLTEFVQAAQAALVAAGDETDPAQRRFYLEETRRLANEALRIDESHVEANDLRTQATTALQAMDAVFDLTPMTEVLVLSTQITGEIAIESLTVNAGIAYLLDTGGGRVIAVPLDGSPPATVYENGQVYNGVTARAPIEMTWQGNDFDGRLLILDEERKLFEARPGALPLPVPLRRTNTWASVEALATFDDNLYVLDPAGNQVHRYLPAAAGFDSEPESILAAEADLTGAIDFAIDGDIFVAYADGRVARFSNGAQAPFPLGGIDRPMTAASDIAVVAPAQEVFIADTGNKRVVVAGTDGAFRRQLVANALTDISAIGIDATGAQLYVIVADVLLTAPIVR